MQAKCFPWPRRSAEPNSAGRVGKVGSARFRSTSTDEKMIDNEGLRALLRSAHEHVVSIFLPTHVAGREIRQDPIRFRGLLDDAAARLLRAGMRRPEIEAMLARAYKLAADETFWRHQEKGLA